MSCTIRAGGKPSVNDQRMEIHHRAREIKRPDLPVRKVKFAAAPVWTGLADRDPSIKQQREFHLGQSTGNQGADETQCSSFRGVQFRHFLRSKLNQPSPRNSKADHQLRPIWLQTSIGLGLKRRSWRSSPMYARSTSSN